MCSSYYACCGIGAHWLKFIIFLQLLLLDILCLNSQGGYSNLIHL